MATVLAALVAPGVAFAAVTSAGEPASPAAVAATPRAGIPAADAPMAAAATASVPERGVQTEAEKKEQERRNILRALEQCRGRVFGEQGAAALLGVKPTTLASRIARLNIEPREFKQRRA